MSIRTRITAAALATTAAASIAIVGAGAAEAMPTEENPAFTMMIHNDTDSTMILQDMDVWGGEATGGIDQQIAPHTMGSVHVENVHGSGFGGTGATIGYHVAGDRFSDNGDVTLAASDALDATGTFGTWKDGSFQVETNTTAGYPDAVFDYYIHH